MGIGTPDYILAAVENGIDMFDCVLQTRTARNGTVFTDHGMLNIKKAFNKYDESPIQEGCTCSACKNYSRGYLHHMFKCNEMFGGMLASEHNLMYMYSFMERIRAAIQEDRFKEFKQDFLNKFYGDKE